MKLHNPLAPAASVEKTKEMPNAINPSQSIHLLSLAVITGVLLTSISACSSIPAIKDKPATAAMDPIELPEWKAGYTKTMVNTQTGEIAGYEIIETDTELGMRMESKRGDRKGCQWTNGPDWFAPSTSWKNCGGTGEWVSGTQKVERISGELWPLRDGTKAAYRRSPVSSKGTKGSVVVRKCEVSGPVTITVSESDFDTMKVVCKSARNNGHRETRTWYWNDEHGEVKYRRTSTEDGLVDDFEIVSAAE